MSDIVDSLRRSAEWVEEVEHESWLGTAELQRDAADEIKRLQTEVELLQTRLSSSIKAHAEDAVGYLKELYLADSLADALCRFNMDDFVHLYDRGDTLHLSDGTRVYVADQECLVVTASLSASSACDKALREYREARRD